MNPIWQDELSGYVRRVRNARKALGNYSRETAGPSGISKYRTITQVADALDNLDACIRYLNTRRQKPTFEVRSEAEVQDIIFLMLRPWVTDIVPENPTDKVASRFVIKDFLLSKLHLVVEAKFIRDKKHGRNITRELHDDIETYRNHPQCSSIIFVIYDPHKYIPDVRSLRRQLEVRRTYETKKIEVKCIVKT